MNNCPYRNPGFPKCNGPNLWTTREDSREFDPDVIHRAACNADAPYTQKTCQTYPWAAAARIRHLEYKLQGLESVPSMRADIALDALFGGVDLSYGSVKDKRDRLELFLRGAGLKIVETGIPRSTVSNWCVAGSGYSALQTK